MHSHKQNLGFGLGLRSKHLPEIFNRNTKAQWFEAISENYLQLSSMSSNANLHNLLKVRENYPVVLHGVSMGIGNAELNVDQMYMDQLTDLIKAVDPEWVSDHICWNSFEGKNSHDLLPLPYTKECLDHVVRKLQQVQEAVRKPFLLENVSSYIQYKSEDYSEWDFLNEICSRSGCKLLLDVNNVFVSSHNHDIDPYEYIRKIDADHIWQIHLAGPKKRGNLLVDSHSTPVFDEVWDLYRFCIREKASVSTMIERDDEIPELAEVEEELLKAKSIHDEVISEGASQ